MRTAADRSRAILIMAVLLLLVSTFGLQAQDPAKLHFKVSLTSKITAGPQVDADVSFEYTIERRKREVNVSFDAIAVKTMIDGKESVEAVMDKERWYSKEKGKVTVDAKRTDATPELKQMMQDGFGPPLCKIEVDATGKELKRTITALPGAKFLIDNGMLANTRLFHVSFPETEDKWTAANEVSMAYGQFAKGNMTYEKLKSSKPDNPNLVTVRVTGTLRADKIGKPDAVTSAKAEYTFQGEQVYDLKLKEWVAGKLSVDVAIETFKDKKKVAVGGGTQTVTLKMINPKP